ncbi:hypothetical protein [Streptomyces sp. CB02923]|uniref:hypothetical protein n=1 Tax=Streptomyces sp. CB02923 TaxID=1718985 RepID=UPI0019007304|nr:hypothetical protein [Streptomyces sp. CB02923]
MKALLWFVLGVCLLGNVCVSAMVDDGLQKVLLSVACGVGVLAAGAGLWVTRPRDRRS